jgi:Domain of unknown function (DUF5666)
MNTQSVRGTTRRHPQPAAIRRRRLQPAGAPLFLLFVAVAVLGCGIARAVSVGEIEVNERTFDIPGEAELSIDDDPVTIDELHDRLEKAEGWRSDDIVVDADATLSTGSVTSIRLENNLKGPITSVDPLRVLGQPFTINGNTVLVGFADPTLLAVGQFLEVSGFVDTSSSLIASRVALEDSPPAQWRLSGFVTQLDGGASTATIGSPPGGQGIAFVGATPADCGTGLQVGDYVVVVADPIGGFVPGQVVDSVTQLRCRPVAQAGEDGEHDAFEGLITSLINDTSFTFAGFTVTHDASTLFRNGNAGDLDEGVRVEVEGTFTSPTTLAARRIKFILAAVRFRAPVAAADVTPGQSITILGNTVLDNAQDRDEDDIMANGLNQTTQVEVRAYLDKLGNLFATRVRSRGDPRTDHYQLQAPAQTVTPPTLTALGLTVDTSSSTFLDESQSPITSQQFFAAISAGTLFEIDDASFDANNNRLFGGVVSLSDDGASANLSAPALLINGKVSGAVTAITPDKVFTDGFEPPGG